MVGDQLLLEIPGILRKLSTTSTGPYHVKNGYKNNTIGIQKEILSERKYNRKTAILFKSTIKYDLGGERHILEYELKDNN
jgi:hypothetical protein